MSEWNETGWETAQEMPGRVLFVSDGVVAHARALTEGETIQTGLEDYAQSYQCESQEIVVEWILFHDGSETDQGRYRFQVK